MKKSLFAVCAGTMLLITGCGPTTEEILAMHDDDLVAGNFEKSLPLMEDKIKGDKENTHEDTPMWRLFVSNAKMLTNDPKAIEEFDKAEDVILQNKKRNQFGAYTAAMLVNDKMLDFKSRFQDKMFISIDKATMYAAAGNRNAARTELNRMMQYQENYLHELKAEIAASSEAMTKSLQPAKKDEKSDIPPIVQEQIDKLKIEAKNTFDNLCNNDNVLGLILKHCSYDLKNSGDFSKLKPADYQNAYAAHFCGVFRWLNNDNGAMYLKDAAKLNTVSKTVAADSADADKNVMPKDEVWVYVEDGLCQKREESRIDLPIALVPFLGNYVKYFGIALPKFVARANAAEKYTVSGADMEELESIDRLLKIEYDIYMNSAVKRELLRALLKTLPQVAAGIIKDQSKGNFQVMAACEGVAYASAAYALASTQADLRTWNVLPKRVLVKRVKRPADGIIKFAADGVNTDIKVAEGNSIIVIRKVAKTSPVIIRQINFAASK